MSQPDYGEQALEVADMLVRSGAIDVVAIDSVAALTPRAELEGQMGDQSVGLQARMMSQAMRKLAGNLNRTQTLCILTNQIREKIGVMFGSPETQPGGRALKFYASQRLDIRRIETLKDGNEAVGNRVRVKVVKNKVAAPFRQAEFDIEFGKGISTAGCLIDLGLEHNIVTKSGSFFSYGEERLGQGRNNAKAYLEEHPDMAKEIEQRIYAAVGVVEHARSCRSSVPTSDGGRRREPDRLRGGGGGDHDRRRASRLSTVADPADAPRTGGSEPPGPARTTRSRAATAISAGASTASPSCGARLVRARLEPEVIEAALAIVTEQGYLDDARYARLLVEDRRSVDGWGAERIRARLQAAGHRARADRRRRSRAPRPRRPSSPPRRRCSSAAARRRPPTTASASAPSAILIRMGYDARARLRRDPRLRVPRPPGRRRGRPTGRPRLILTSALARLQVHVQLRPRSAVRHHHRQQVAPVAEPAAMVHLDPRTDDARAPADHARARKRRVCVVKAPRLPFALSGMVVVAEAAPVLRT